MSQYDYDKYKCYCTVNYFATILLYQMFFYVIEIQEESVSFQLIEESHNDRIE